MTDYKFFIINTLLLVVLISGASYLQKTYDTDKAGQKALVPTTTATTSTNTNGWQISTPTVTNTPAASGKTVVPSVTQKATPAAPKPVIRRVYNREGDDD